MILGRIKGRGRFAGKELLLKDHSLEIVGTGAVDFATVADLDAEGRVEWEAGEGDAFRNWVLKRAAEAGWKPPAEEPAEEPPPVKDPTTPAAPVNEPPAEQPPVMEPPSEKPERRIAKKPEPVAVSAPTPELTAEERPSEPRKGMSSGTRMVFGVIAMLAFAAMVAAALSRPIERQPLPTPQVTPVASEETSQ